MEYVLVVVTVIVVLWLIITTGGGESFSNDIRFQSISSGSPVPYDAYPITHGDGYHIRRWRTPIPQTSNAKIQAPNWPTNSGLEMPAQQIVPRTVHDDVWARTYASGVGFQLG